MAQVQPVVGRLKLFKLAFAFACFCLFGPRWAVPESRAKIKVSKIGILRENLPTDVTYQFRHISRHQRSAFVVLALISVSLTMAPPYTRSSSSQTKISETFKATSKSSKPVKQTKPLSSRTPSASTTSSKTPSPVLPASVPSPALAKNPKLVFAAKKIESQREAPFGTPLLNQR
jgi:hypothetical protein